LLYKKYEKEKEMHTSGSDTGVRRTEVANEEMVGINDHYTE